MTRQSFDMYTAAGDRACAALVIRISKSIRINNRITPHEIQELYDKGREKISVKHGEVFDTEPRVEIAAAVNKVLKEVGYRFKLSYFGDVEMCD